MRLPLAERIFDAAAADQHSAHVNFGFVRVEFHSGASRGSQDAAPVGIGAGEHCFYQRRARDGARHLFGGAIVRRAADFDFDYVTRAFAIADNLQGKRVATSSSAVTNRV